MCYWIQGLPSREIRFAQRIVLEHYVTLDNRPDIVPEKWPDQTINLQMPPKDDTASV